MFITSFHYRNGLSCWNHSLLPTSSSSLYVPTKLWTENLTVPCCLDWRQGHHSTLLLNIMTQTLIKLLFMTYWQWLGLKKKNALEFNLRKQNVGILIWKSSIDETLLTAGDTVSQAAGAFLTAAMAINVSHSLYQPFLLWVEGCMNNP